MRHLLNASPHVALAPPRARDTFCDIRVKQGLRQMLHRARSRAFLFLLAGAALGPAQAALAQSAAPCTTSAECAAQSEQRDNAARRDEYQRITAGQESAHAAAIAAQFDARARRQGDRQAKLAAILERRRAAYAATHN